MSEVTDEHGAKPLWQYDDCEIYDDFIKLDCKGIGWIDVIRREIDNDPLCAYRRILGDYHLSPDKLYDAFLWLATYWDLQCDFDELRKIRDEMKEPAE